MRAENFDVNDIIDHMQGSSNGWSFDCCFGEDGILNKDFTPKYPNMTDDDLTDDDYAAIDNCIFYCCNCGWWCESSEGTELNGEQVCTDCKEQEEQ